MILARQLLVEYLSLSPVSIQHLASDLIMSAFSLFAATSFASMNLRHGSVHIQVVSAAAAAARQARSCAAAAAAAAHQLAAAGSLAGP